MSRRDEIVTQLKAQIDEVNQRIGDIEARVDQLKGDAESTYRQRLEDMRDRERRLRGKLQELRDAGEDRWDQLRAEAETLQTALQRSFNYFKSQL